MIGQLLRREPAPHEPRLVDDDRVFTAHVERARAEDHRVVRCEAEHDAPGRSTARCRAPPATSRRGVHCSGSSASTGALRVVERRAGDDARCGRRSRPRSGNGERFSQPSITARPSSGDVKLDVTWPTMSSSDRIGLPSVGAAPSIVSGTSRRWSGSEAVRASAARPMKSGLSIFTAQSMPMRRGVVSSSVSMPTITWPFSSRRPNSARRPWGRRPSGRPAADELPPQLDGSISGVVELEGGLTREAQPHDVARHTGDLGVDVLEEPWRFVEADEPEQLSGERAGDVDRGERHRAVEHVHVAAPTSRSSRGSTSRRSRRRPT